MAGNSVLRTCLPAALLLALLAAPPAYAHKIHVFAVAEGKELTGNVYASDGSTIRQANVTVFDAAGARLGETTTNGQGEFRFPIHSRTDHRVVVDAGEGHGAEYTVKADEIAAALSETAAPLASGTPRNGGSPRAATADSEQPAAPAGRQAADGARSVPATLEGKVEEVRQQVVQLRRQLDGYEQRTRLHDVLGGVGVIVGVTGLWFFLAGRRARGKRD